MNILFLANRVPYPPFRGDKLKIYHLARHLSRRHQLHLLCFAQNRDEMNYRRELEPYFQTVRFVYQPGWKSLFQSAASLWGSVPFQVAYFRSAAMKKALAEIMEQVPLDLIHVQHLRMAQYPLPLGSVPAILDMPDAFSLYWTRRKQRERSWLARQFAGEESRRLIAYEKAMLDAYPQVLVCSQEDQAYLKETHKVSRIDLLPNGVDLDQFSPRGQDYAALSPVLFTGNMDYAPNVDAVVHFVHNIWPRIQRALPGLRFVIAGQRPVKAVKDLASESVVVTGFVEDLAGVYHQSSVLVSPLRFGAGTQNKVLEALAMGVPVVSTPIGFKGLGLQSGQGAFMENSDEQFADRVISLINSPEQRKETGQKGMEMIRARFGWEAVSARLESFMEEQVHRFSLAGKG